VKLSDIVKEDVGELDCIVVESPPWGSEKVLTRNFVANRLKGSSAKLSGAEKIIVTRPIVDRTEEIANELRSIIKDKIAQRRTVVPPDSIKVEFVRFPESIKVPTGGFSLSALLPDDLLGYSIVNCKLDGAGRFHKHFSVACLFHADAVCAVAVKKIGRGEIIQTDCFEWVPVDLSTCYEMPVTRKYEITGWRAKRLIPKGKVIPLRSVEKSPDIFRGQEVTIRIARGSLTVQARGRALEDGYKGSRIMVKNLVSKRIEKYSVVGDGVVSPVSIKGYER